MGATENQEHPESVALTLHTMLQEPHVMTREERAAARRLVEKVGPNLCTQYSSM